MLLIQLLAAKRSAFMVFERFIYRIRPQNKLI